MFGSDDTVRALPNIDHSARPRRLPRGTSLFARRTSSLPRKKPLAGRIRITKPSHPRVVNQTALRGQKGRGMALWAKWRAYGATRWDWKPRLAQSARRRASFRPAWWIASVMPLWPVACVQVSSAPYVLSSPRTMLLGLSRHPDESLSRSVRVTEVTVLHASMRGGKHMA